MQSTPSPKPTDDPCDDVMIAPDVVQVAPSDDELSNLLHQTARHRLATPTRTAPEVRADSVLRPVAAIADAKLANDDRISKEPAARPTAPLVDAMLRPAPANHDRGSRIRRSLVRQATSAFIALLLAVCIGLVAVTWKPYGAAATKMIVKAATQVVVGSEQEESSVAAQPAGRAEAANAVSARPAPPASTPPAPDVTAPADSTQLLQSMTRDLAALGQEIDELKASMEQLKANQQQMLRDAAKTSEQNPRPRTSAPPPRPAAAQVHKPQYSYSPPQGATAPPVLPRVAAPYYVPLQPEPVSRATAEPPTEADSASVPRPPMPLR